MIHGMQRGDPDSPSELQHRAGYVAGRQVTAQFSSFSGSVSSTVRGLLLHGPPGTGKTFACRYLCGRMGNTTRIVVTGNVLNRIGQLFEFARV